MAGESLAAAAAGYAGRTAMQLARDYMPGLREDTYPARLLHNAVRTETNKLLNIAHRAAKLEGTLRAATLELDMLLLVGVAGVDYVEEASLQQLVKLPLWGRMTGDLTHVLCSSTSPARQVQAAQLLVEVRMYEAFAFRRPNRHQNFQLATRLIMTTIFHSNKFDITKTVFGKKPVITNDGRKKVIEAVKSLVKTCLCCNILLGSTTPQAFVDVLTAIEPDYGPMNLAWMFDCEDVLLENEDVLLEKSSDFSWPPLKQWLMDRKGIDGRMDYVEFVHHDDTVIHVSVCDCHSFGVVMGKAVDSADGRDFFACMVQTCSFLTATLIKRVVVFQNYTDNSDAYALPIRRPDDNGRFVVLQIASSQIRFITVNGYETKLLRHDQPYGKQHAYICATKCYDTYRFLISSCNGHIWATAFYLEGRHVRFGKGTEFTLLRHQSGTFYAFIWGAPCSGDLTIMALRDGQIIVASQGQSSPSCTNVTFFRPNGTKRHIVDIIMGSRILIEAIDKDGSTFSMCPRRIARLDGRQENVRFETTL